MLKLRRFGSSFAVLLVTMETILIKKFHFFDCSGKHLSSSTLSKTIWERFPAPVSRGQTETVRVCQIFTKRALENSLDQWQRMTAPLGVMC